MTTNVTTSTGVLVLDEKVPTIRRGDLVTRWQTSLRSESTRRGYLVDLRTFAEWCQSHDVEVLSVDRAVVDLWVAVLTETHRPATVARKVAALASFFEYATDEGVIAKNPTARVKRPTVRVDDQMTTPARTVDEFRRALGAASGPRDRALLIALGVMGLRVSEALALDLGTVELDHGHATVVVTGKGNRRSRVVVVPPMLAVLDELMADEGRETGPVFARHGVRWNRAQAARALARMGRRAGLDGVLRPHQLRATAITVALELGEPLHKVQTFARHVSPVTTRRYDANRLSLDGSPAYALASALVE